jgi:hypothetical protein
MLLPALPAPLPVAWLKRLGIHTLLGGVKVEEFDALHGYIYGDEMVRSGLAGPGASLTTGMGFGVPLIVKFAGRELQERVLPGLLRGETRCCIAITEPDAGSDVAGIGTSAVRSECGRWWVVDGAKKWWVFLFFLVLCVGGRYLDRVDADDTGSQTASGLTTRPWRCVLVRPAAAPRASPCCSSR